MRRLLILLTSSLCPLFSYQMLEYTYFTSDSAMPWTDAEEYCESYNNITTQSAVFHSETDHRSAAQTCFDAIQSANETVAGCWIGLYSLGGQWQWIDGSITDYGFINNSIPDSTNYPWRYMTNLNSESACVFMAPYTDGRWNIDHSYILYAMCQTLITMDPSSAPTSAPTSATIHPTFTPTSVTIHPTLYPTRLPSHTPSIAPTVIPTISPSIHPTTSPSFIPTSHPNIISSTSHNEDDTMINVFIAISIAIAFVICILVVKCVYEKREQDKHEIVNQFNITVKTTVKTSKLSMEEVVNTINITNVDTKEVSIHKQSDIMQWLTNVVHLPQYCDSFVQNGYHDMEFVRDIQNKSDLEDIGITKKGHQTRIIAQIKFLNGKEGEAVRDQDLVDESILNSKDGVQSVHEQAVHVDIH
eukprot:345365_1